MSRYVTAEPVRPEERFALYRLCECAACNGTGKDWGGTADKQFRCPECRGEGRERQQVATCATAEALGVAIVTLGREGEFDECPVGILDRIPDDGNKKWVLLPWLPSARNVSDAGRTLARSKGKT